MQFNKHFQPLLNCINIYLSTNWTLSDYCRFDSEAARQAVDRIVIVPHNCHYNQNVWLKYDHRVMYKKYTTPLPSSGMDVSKHFYDIIKLLGGGVMWGNLFGCQTDKIGNYPASLRLMASVNVVVTFAFKVPVFWTVVYVIMISLNMPLF